MAQGPEAPHLLQRRASGVPFANDNLNDQLTQNLLSAQHPFPVAGRGEGGLQTSPEEVKFRWEGLTSWMERGLTYWWCKSSQDPTPIAFSAFPKDSNERCV